MRRMMFCLFIVGAITFLSSPAANAQMQIYGAWHCGNDACTWASVRNMTDFDTKNHWLIDRGDGSGLPSVNLVILSFVNPLRLLNKTNDAQTSQGVPIGMTQDVVNYFKAKNIRVMLSIGGITYVSDWNTALDTNPTQLGINAAEWRTDWAWGWKLIMRRTAIQGWLRCSRLSMPIVPMFIPSTEKERNMMRRELIRRRG